tara:strand:- start:271 stop:807 length:537 start_codon:yes stop_codon:yes gene_type:complete
MKTFILMQYKFLITFVYLFFSFNAFSFEKFSLNDIDPSENTIIENMYEPLKVTGDAIPWQLFSKTEEVEDCTIDKDGFNYCIIKPLYHNEIKKFNNKTVTVMGFMFPLEQSEKQKKFLLGPYPLGCPFHYHVGPSQVIEINSTEPIDFSFDPITITGKLKINYNKETGTFYYLELDKS